MKEFSRACAEALTLKEFDASAECFFDTEFGCFIALNDDSPGLPPIRCRLVVYARLDGQFVVGKTYPGWRPGVVFKFCEVAGFSDPMAALMEFHARYAAIKGKSNPDISKIILSTFRRK